MSYHPEHSWLEQYAAGTLPLPVALCVATHLYFCVDCRRQVDLLQNLGGVLVEQLAPVPVSDDLLQSIFAKIGTPPPAISSTPSDDEVESIPRPLRKLVACDYRQLPWSWLLPSLHAVDLQASDDDYSVALHRITAGGKVARHDHRGQEFTVVLRGSFSDESGVYATGDFVLREPGQAHRPLAAQNEECICLTVQQAQVRFTGWFWRLLNPLLR